MAGLLEGVLPAIYSGADQVKRRVKGLLSDPREFMGQRSQDLRTMQDQDSALAYSRGLLSPKDPAHAQASRNEPAFNQQQASAAEQRLMDIAMQGLTVWHGSPHKFDKFDMSKIGTGEGAQAYGHGLYFAEASDVAKQYADNVKDMGAVKNINSELSRLAKVMSVDEVPGSYRKYRTDAGRQAAQRYDELMAERSGVSSAPGNMYKVDLPDSAIEKMLDWDKPLSQQPEAARVALTERLRAHPLFQRWSDSGALDNAPAGTLVQNILNGGDSHSRALLSDDLARSGIPGIRYLDGGSRGAGTGTRNFVVFDDQLPKILEVNGGLLGR